MSVVEGFVDSVDIIMLSIVYKRGNEFVYKRFTIALSIRVFTSLHLNIQTDVAGIRIFHEK